MTTSGIPFNRPTLGSLEKSYLDQVLAGGSLSGNGPFTRQCEDLLARELGAPRVLLTTSCTHALEMAALLLMVGPDDEVIMPSYTFVSTANAFVLRGARPVFVDIREDTLNLDEERIEEAIGPSTKAIVPVHYGGVACEMDTIVESARRHDVEVIEDNAHGLFGRYRGKYLGTFGSLATQSFHETKNYTCGEGGALVLNDPGVVERAEFLREKGTNRSAYFRKEVDKYSWVDLGSSYVPSELNAAVLLAQLQRRKEIEARRRKIWERYREGLSDWARNHQIQLPIVPSHCEPPFHMFYLVAPTPEFGDSLMAYLKTQQVLAVFHYVPLHSSVMGVRYGRTSGNLEVTDRVSRRIIRLPLFFDLSEREQDFIVELITSFSADK